MVHSLKRIMVDSSVFIAAAGSNSGARSASVSILMLGELGFIQLVVSEQIVEEVDRHIRSMLQTESGKKEALANYRRLMQVVQLQIVADPAPEEYRKWAKITDPKDAPIIGAAIISNVDYLLSLNTKHFTEAVSEQAGIPFLTPSAFIQQIRSIIGKNL